MPKLTAVDASFLRSAPLIAVHTGVVPAPPAAVFALMGPDPALWSWVPQLDDRGHYTSEGPPGVGSVRTMYVRGKPAVETVLAYEPDRRFAFRMDSGSMRRVRAFAEDFLLAPTADGRTTFTWTFAIDGPPVWARPVLNLVTKAVFRKMVRGLTIRTAG